MLKMRDSSSLYFITKKKVPLQNTSSAQQTVENCCEISCEKKVVFQSSWKTKLSNLSR